MLHLAALAAAGALSAQQGEGMDGYFKATLSLTILGQWSADRFFEPDHTYTQTGDDGVVHGAWAIRDGKICTTQANPPADRLATYCNTGVGKAPGDQWKDADPQTGAVILMSLSPGRTPAK